MEVRRIAGIKALCGGYNNSAKTATTVSGSFTAYGFDVLAA